MLKNWINEDYLNKELKNEFSKNKPFPHLVLTNFFNELKLKRVLKSLEQEEFMEKNSDLFQFKQGKEDIKGTKIKELKEFYLFFSSEEFGEYIRKITGLNIELGTIDMGAFIYQKTDYLLPHDDRLEGRKIAYVVNLSENFNEEDGGRLQLFAVKGNKPDKIVNSYVPKFNSLVLFEVSKNSYHKVEEVFTDKDRISLTGWFHGH